MWRRLRHWKRICSAANFAEGRQAGVSHDSRASGVGRRGPFLKLFVDTGSTIPPRSVLPSPAICANSVRMPRPCSGRPRPRATRGGSVRTAHHRNTQGGQTGMAESWRGTRIREGQRWLHAAVEAVLAQASIPLAARAVHQPAVYWETQTDTRRSLYLWLAVEATPRQLPFMSTLIEDCGAGSRLRHAYARFYILRSLRQMGLLSSSAASHGHPDDW